MDGRPEPDSLDPGGALNAVDELFYVFTPGGEFRYWNDALSEVTGYDDATIATMSPTEFFVGDDRTRVADAISRALDDEYVRVEARVRTNDGECIPYEFSGVSYTDGSEELVAGVGRNITERKRREEELQIGEYAIESALSGIVIADLDGDVSAVNPAFLDMWGYDSEADVLGRPATEFWKRPSEARKVVKTVRETGGWNGELLAVRRDGTTFHARCSASVVTDEEGTPLALMASFADITARKEHERELQRRNEQLNEFASVVSHDLRNPLGVAKGHVRMAREEYDGDHLEPAEEALERMETIIEDTLTLAREGQAVGEPESIRIREVVGHCWGMVDTGEASLDVTEEFSLYADRDRLHHLFENLFRNAVEHAGAGVTVRVGPLDGVGFYVEDDGPGIPQEEREKVLEPGYTGTSGGTGFGLTIVNRIAQAHGWELAVTDGDEGGARFEFTNVDVHRPDEAVETGSLG
jgi:PAS domain S-box-containing protein